MKTLATLLATAAVTASAPGSLIITGVFDGPLPGGDPKGIELYATSAIADLSVFGLETASNGGASGGAPEASLPAVSLGAGEFYYISNSSDGDFTQWFGFAADFQGPPGGAVNHNGDDVLLLYQDGIVIDSFGVLGVDGTGEPWETLDGWAYRNDGVTANGGAFDAGNWSFSGPNAWDGDDNFDGGRDNGTNATASPPFPAGTFQIPEPTSALLGGIGLGLVLLLRRKK